MTLRTVALFAAALAIFAGCGKPTKKMVTVNGSVTYGGRTVKSGVVKFQAPNGDFAIANIGQDGQFIMTDVTPGEQKVAYQGGPMGSGSSDGAKTAPAEKPVSVPMKFGDFETSGVTVTVPEKGGAVTVELK
jgi:hypothetical protein